MSLKIAQLMLFYDIRDYNLNLGLSLLQFHILKTDFATKGTEIYFDRLCFCW